MLAAYEVETISERSGLVATKSYLRADVLQPPLTLIQTAAEYGVRRERSHAKLVEAMEKALRESKRTSQLIDNLLSLARAAEARPRPC